MFPILKKSYVNQNKNFFKFVFLHNLYERSNDMYVKTEKKISEYLSEKSKKIIIISGSK